MSEDMENNVFRSDGLEIRNTLKDFRDDPKMEMVDGRELEFIADVAFAAVPTERDMIGVQITSMVADPREMDAEQAKFAKIVRNYLIPISTLPLLREMITRAIEFHDQFWARWDKNDNKEG